MCYMQVHLYIFNTKWTSNGSTTEIDKKNLSNLKYSNTPHKYWAKNVQALLPRINFTKKNF